jgi:hypothetical protein
MGYAAAQMVDCSPCSAQGLEDPWYVLREEHVVHKVDWEKVGTVRQADPARDFFERLQEFHTTLIGYGTMMQSCYDASLAHYNQAKTAALQATIQLARHHVDWIEFRVQVSAKASISQTSGVKPAESSAATSALTCGLSLEVTLESTGLDQATVRCFVIPIWEQDDDQESAHPSTTYVAGAFFPSASVVDENVIVTVRVLHRAFDGWIDDRTPKGPAEDTHSFQLQNGKRSFDGSTLLKTNLRDITQGDKGTTTLPSDATSGRQLPCPGYMSCGYWSIKHRKWFTVRPPGENGRWTLPCGTQPNQITFVMIGDSLTRYQQNSRPFKSAFYDTLTTYEDVGELRWERHPHMMGKSSRDLGGRLFIDWLSGINSTYYHGNGYSNPRSIRDGMSVDSFRWTVLVISVGIRDVARMNTFADFQSTMQRIKRALLSLHPSIIPVWRTASAMHNSRVPNTFGNVISKKNIGYRSTSTELRNQVNSFLGGNIMSPEVRVMDGYSPSFAASLDEMKEQDIHHYKDRIYGVWTDMLLGHCSESSESR